jgi:hypothetical protein
MVRWQIIVATDLAFFILGAALGAVDAPAEFQIVAGQTPTTPRLASYIAFYGGPLFLIWACIMLWSFKRRSMKLEMLSPILVLSIAITYLAVGLTGSGAKQIASCMLPPALLCSVVNAVLAVRSIVNLVR